MSGVPSMLISWPTNAPLFGSKALIAPIVTSKRTGAEAYSVGRRRDRSETPQCASPRPFDTVGTPQPKIVK